MTIGQRLREIRADLGYNQRQAANLAGMRYQYLSDLECERISNPSLETLTRLARAYGMGVDQLIGAAVSHARDELPEGLQELLEDPEWGDQITPEWIEALLRIDYQGRRLRTKRDFLEAYLALSRILEAHT